MRNRKEIAIDSDIEDVEISIDLQCAVLSVLHVQTLHLNTSRELTIALIECGGGVYKLKKCVRSCNYRLCNMI